MYHMDAANMSKLTEYNLQLQQDRSARRSNHSTVSPTTLVLEEISMDEVPEIGSAATHFSRSLGFDTSSQAMEARVGHIIDNCRRVEPTTCTQQQLQVGLNELQLAVDEAN